MFRLPIVKFFSRILNRITITVVLVALQVAWLLWAFFSLTTGRVWVNVGLQLLSLLMMLYLVRKDENSAYKIGWIALMGVLPLLGGALYLSFGNKRPAKQLRNKLKAVDDAHKADLVQQPGQTDGLDASGLGMSRYLARYGRYPAWKNTAAQYFACGEAMYPQLLQDLERAEHTIFVEFFILHTGKMWDGVEAILRRKAAQDGHGFGNSGRAAGRKHRHDDHSLKTKKPLPDKRQEAASEKRESDLVLADALRHILRVLAEADDQIALGVGHQTLKLREEIHQLGRFGLRQLEERINIDHADIVIARENTGQEAVERRLALDGVLARVDEADLRLEAKRIALVIVDEQNVALRFLHGSVRHIQNALGLAGTLLAKDNLDHGQSLPFLFSDYPHYSLKHPFCIAPKFLFSPKKARGQRINLSFLLVYLAFFRQACYKYFIQLFQKEEAG